MAHLLHQTPAHDAHIMIKCTHASPCLNLPDCQVYDPIVEGCLVKGARKGSSVGPSKAVRRLGVIASFMASGLVHEYIFWSVRGPSSFIRPLVLRCAVLRASPWKAACCMCMTRQTMYVPVRQCRK